MRYHVDLAEARRRAIPIVERPNRNLAPDCRVEACTSPLAAARRDLYIAEQAIDCCSADRENTMTIHLAKLQSPVLFKRWQQIGIITLNRLPHTRSDASHRAVSASLVVAPYLRLR